ncbi:tetratricopeptide repeat protein [Sporosarcina gallistercoris]|uniref:Tetratricopeptide repeat protein n=1 Tax=Sporosarcina gallistercoris TaxID=2762245 RepID=A0ABR8PFM6_9BACL|nr:tetratricopeptide repeat protein [Sporosarcina gallistercoris]MBD7906948.1 tetratricopeptide repeat protein [Sporosarcina gallistercoris]
MEQVQQLEKMIMNGNLQAVEETVEQLTKSIEFDAIYDSATLLMEYGLVPQADQLYDALLTHMPDAGQLKIDRAEALMALGREDEALLLLTDILKEEEEYLQALLLLADYYQTIGMAEVALSKIDEAEELAPEEPVIRFAKAELLLESGKYSEAVRLYLQLRERGLDEVGGTSLESRIAEAYSAGGAYEEAVPYYESLLKDGKVLPDTLFGAAYSQYQSGNSQPALRHLNQLIEMDPDYFSAYMLAGQASLLLEENENALTFFTEGIRRDEFDKELHLAAGKVALKLGRPGEAERFLGDALALDPEYVEARISLASLYEQQEHYENLLELLQDTSEEQLEIPLLAAFKAYAEENLEHYTEAYDSYVQAYTGMKEDPEFLERYAKFLLEEGKRSEAVNIVKELMVLVPDLPEWASFLEDQEEEEA